MRTGKRSLIVGGCCDVMIRKDMMGLMKHYGEQRPPCFDACSGMSWCSERQKTIDPTISESVMTLTCKCQVQTFPFVSYRRLMLALQLHGRRCGCTRFPNLLGYQLVAGGCNCESTS